MNTAEFYLGAVSCIDSPLTYASSNSAIATIGNKKMCIFGNVTSNIAASAVGGGSYGAAINVQQFIVQCSCVQ